MMQHTSFSNESILNSTLLSSMVYLESQLIREGELLQEKLVSRKKTKDFIETHSLSSINSVSEFEHYLEIYLKQLTDEDIYKKIIAEKLKFYQIFKEELKLEDLSANSLYSKAKNDCFLETTKIIAKEFSRELAVDDSLKILLGEINSKETSVKNLETKNEDKEQLSQSTRLFWGKFTALRFSEEIVEKYKYYSPKNDSEINVSFKNGYVEAGKVGKVKDACLLIGKTEENGQSVLYISFRGTERKAKSAFKYFLQNYPNMERQYNYFEPILRELITNEIDQNKLTSSNQPLRVVFTGHSLGAALAEKALDKFKNSEDVTYKGIFVSNPGSFHYLQGVVNKLDQWENDADIINKRSGKFLELGVLAVKGAIKYAKVAVLLSVASVNFMREAVKVMYQERVVSDINANLVRGATMGLANFLSIGLGAVFSGIGKIGKFAFSPFVTKKEADPRGLTINHERDNIPQLGKVLFQNSNPQNVILKDLILEVENRETLWKKIVHMEYHGREHYFAELSKKACNGIIFDKSLILDNVCKLRENETSFNSSTKNNEPKSPS